jgi:hypothetical protein
VLALILIVAPPPHPMDRDYPEVRIEDALAFGVDPVSARVNWLSCGRHRTAMTPIIANGWNNPPEVVTAWEVECAARERAWYLLDDALFCDNLTLRAKLRALHELRTILGPEDYHAGRMPSPFPQYRIPAR